MSIYIEPKRLILREFTLDCLEKLKSICSEYYILKWMSEIIYHSRKVIGS